MDLGALDLLVLCGGQGTRLRALFPDTPKLLVPIRGRTFLSHFLDELTAQGLRRFTFAVGHLSESIRHAVREEGKHRPEIQVRISVETKPMGTAGAVRHALPLLSGDTVLVANGDSYIDLDYRKFFAAHRAYQAELTIACTKIENAEAYGSIALSPDHRIQAFAEKAQSQSPQVNAGIYAFQRSLLEELPKTTPASLETEFFPSLVGRPVFGYPVNKRLWDIGTPERYEEANRTLFVR